MKPAVNVLEVVQEIQSQTPSPKPEDIISKEELQTEVETIAKNWIGRHIR